MLPVNTYRISFNTCILKHVLEQIKMLLNHDSSMNIAENGNCYELH